LAVPIKNDFSLYGAAVRLTNSYRALDEQIRFFLHPFVQPCRASVAGQIQGEICAFDLGEVTHSLSQAAGSRRYSDDLVEIYSLADKHWIVDDRWGVCEIDQLRRRWKSWVFPEPSLDPIHLAEAAILKPMAQLLRYRGVELLPAISIERSGWGALILSPYPISREIARLVRAGYRVIGQRWTALVYQNNRIVLRHLPGAVETLGAHGRSISRRPIWTDLTADNPWASADLSWCDAAIIVAAGRRIQTVGRIIPVEQSQGALRRAWPIPDLPIGRPRLLHPAAALARDCYCLGLQLSRREEEFLDFIELARRRTVAKVQVSIHQALRRHVTAGHPGSGAMGIAG
jgi:hypothetical protein